MRQQTLKKIVLRYLTVLHYNKKHFWQLPNFYFFKIRHCHHNTQVYYLLIASATNYPKQHVISLLFFTVMTKTSKGEVKSVITNDPQNLWLYQRFFKPVSLYNHNDSTHVEYFYTYTRLQYVAKHKNKTVQTLGVQLTTKTEGPIGVSMRLAEGESLFLLDVYLFFCS